MFWPLNKQVSLREFSFTDIVNTQIEYLQLKFTARLESRFHEKTKYDPYDNVLYTVFIVKMKYVYASETLVFIFECAKYIANFQNVDIDNNFFEFMKCPDIQRYL